MISYKQFLFEFMDKWWSTPLILVGLVVVANLVLACWEGYIVRKGIRQMSDDDLANVAFKIEWDYLEFMGLEHRPVKRFIQLCETRDIDTLCNEWPTLETAFVGLESEAGRTGRPFIMDYYYTQGVYLRAYRKRLRNLGRNKHV